MSPLKTEHIYPPIPIRDADWIAYVEGEEERRQYGYGRTEQEAIDDWHDQYEQQRQS